MLYSDLLREFQKTQPRADKFLKVNTGKLDTQRLMKRCSACGCKQVQVQGEEFERLTRFKTSDDHQSKLRAI